MVSFWAQKKDFTEMLVFKNKVIWLVFLQPVTQLGKFAVVCGAKDFEVRP